MKKTAPKIKIVDNTDLRAKIEILYEQTNRIDVAKWAIKCAKHVLILSEVAEPYTTVIEDGCRINEMWQTANATVHEVREAGFKIHEIARQCTSEIIKNAIRTSGHAVAVGHMREHAMVCTDYAIKTIQLVFPDQPDKITQERQWQLNELQQYKEQT